MTNALKAEKAFIKDKEEIIVQIISFEDSAYTICMSLLFYQISNNIESLLRSFFERKTILKENGDAGCYSHYSWLSSRFTASTF